jgi:hypothetical protein
MRVDFKANQRSTKADGSSLCGERNPVNTTCTGSDTPPNTGLDRTPEWIVGWRSPVYHGTLSNVMTVQGEDLVSSSSANTTK